MKKWLSLLVMTCVLFGAAYYAVATESGQKLKSRAEKSRAFLVEVDALLAKEPNNSDLLGKRALILADLAAVGESAPEAVQSIGTDDSKSRLQAETKAPSVDPAYYNMLLERLNAGSVLSATERAELLAKGRDLGENDPAFRAVLAKADQQNYYRSLLDRMNANQQLTPTEKNDLENSGLLDNREEHDGLDNTGGPSAMGYRWVDNQAGDSAFYAWEELDTTAGATSITGWGSEDDDYRQITWGWNFNFFGTNYTSGYVSTNGFLALAAGSSSYSNDCPRASAFNGPSGPAIFPYWDDLHLGTGGPGVPDEGRIVWQNFGDHVTVTWDSVGVCCTDGSDLIDFQMQIWASGKIKFQYRYIHKNFVDSGDHDGTSPNIGIQQSNSTGNLDYLNYYCNSSVVDSAYTNHLGGRAIWFYQLFFNNDFSAETLLQPSPLRVAPGSEFNIVGRFRNVGNITQTCPVKYRFNGGPVVAENTASLGLNGTEDHDFAGTVTAPLTVGDYELLVYSDLINDQDRTNDTIRATVLVRECFDESFTDGFVDAGTTCGAVDNWNETCLGDADQSEDYVYQWTTTSNGAWNLQLTASEATHGLVISTSCPPTSDNCVAFLNLYQDTLSFSCLPLAAGTYYIGIDRFSGCDAFNLTVSECTSIGRCCYDNNTSCADNGAYDCHLLGGTWNGNTTCAASPCPVDQDGGENCANAVTIPVPYTPRGTTVGGVDDDPGFECALGSSDAYFGTNTAPDKWYKIVGTGNDITVSLCNAYTTFDTQILVTCSGDCQNFTCVAGNDDVFGACGPNTASSIATFCSELGREYYVVVDGWAAASGQYELAVTQGSACVNFVNCAPTGRCCYLNNGVAACTDNLPAECTALNGQWDDAATCGIDPCPTGRCCYYNGAAMCEDITELECGALDGEWDEFSTCVDDPCPTARCCYLDNGVAACIDNVEQECAALNGDWDEFSTCVDDPCPTGRCCYLDNGLAACSDNTAAECIALNGLWDEFETCVDNPCPIGRCCYRDGVDMACAENTAIECREFSGMWHEDSVCTGFVCPEQVEGGLTCADAIPLTVPTTVAGVTTDGSVDGDPGTQCNLGSPDPYEGFNDAPDEWYVVAGTGHTMTVSLCNDFTDFDTQIAVYCTEDCVDFMCVAGNDDSDCEISSVYSAATFCTQVGSRYYILVDGWGANSGVFQLSITDDGVACADPVACPIITVPCDPIANLAVSVVTAANAPEHLQLHFTAPQDADYKVWYTTVPNNDGNPDDGADANFVLENTILGVTATQNVVYDSPTGFSPYRYYVVTANCGN